MEKKPYKLSNWFLYRPKTSGFIFFLFLLSLIGLIVSQRYQLFQENKEREIANILDGVEQNIEQTVKSSYTVALTLALTVDNNGVPQNFDEVAKQLIASNPDLQAVQLVPNGVVKYVYPLKGNEAVLNLDLFKSPPRTILEAQKAIKSRKMYYQGPVKLTQGGMGVVGRLPLFINNKFWGFSAVVIRLEKLFKTAGIDNNKYKDYQFQFSKINDLTHKEEFFLPATRDFDSNQSKSINFPDGDWKLYVVNASPYSSWFQLVSAILFGLGLAGLSSYLLTRLLKKQAQLHGKVSDQASQLMATESKFKNIFDHAAIGIARVNSITGQVLEVNQYLCSFLGYTEEELMRKKIKTIIYPDDLAEDRILFKQLLSGEIRQFNTEKRYLTKDGKVIWGNVIITPLWNEDEAPSTHIVIVEDVTQRKQEEQILIASQQRIESLINTVDGIVWEGNPKETTYTFVSKKVQDILGYTVKQFKNTPRFWFDHLHPEDKERVEDYIAKSNKHEKQLDFEYRMIAKDKSIVWIRDIVTIIREAGQPVKLRGIMIDITNQKHAEEALNKSFQLVTEQNKRLLNFSYIVSHNLRSHSSNIQGISTLIESAKTEEDRDEMIQLLKTVANNLNETLFNLNNIINIQTSIDIIVEPLNLYDYIAKTLITQNAQILVKEATVLIKVDEDIEIMYNKAYLESILLNLISNALRYSHPDRKPVISMACFEENGQLVLHVSDNGIGIDLKKYGDKMFGIYQTFNGNADARGFGLFISKNQVEAMGGKIEVESDLNKGTTFKIYFK
ncbi:PAS domain-containing protein [Pedobacter boryungensis]|uniref:histidine kinase n=1 Tax=Pedobacter boryungensis TaxID=869962 RepID=A0ABX2D850_9SPHI|nr:PAS domain-containing protein [Pedobacter boryungensis]NQX30227.1 PAS domain-containing protein [Pedobacter boryungensis]